MWIRDDSVWVKTLNLDGMLSLSEKDCVGKYYVKFALILIKNAPTPSQSSFNVVKIAPTLVKSIPTLVKIAPILSNYSSVVD